MLGFHSHHGVRWNNNREGGGCGSDGIAECVSLVL
jgi:hypothetical protein